MPAMSPAARLAFAAIALLLGACVGGPDENATGEEMYAQLCARCHGADHSGGVGPALGPDSNSAHQPDEFMSTAITNGMGRMPSFSSTLSADQVDRLVEYLRQVQGQS